MSSPFPPIINPSPLPTTIPVPLPNQTMIIDSGTYSVLDNLFNDHPNILYFYFLPGRYTITKILKVLTNGVQLIGTGANPTDVYITQVNISDGLALIEVQNVVINNISIECKKSQQCALVTESINNTLVQNCHFYGTSDFFTIYYAGPTNLPAGHDTINAFMSKKLDSNNQFINNTVYSDWAGDAVSYSLQINGSFNNNFIRGGRLAVYMCRNCLIVKNTISDSTSHGIYVSFPSSNLKIYNNMIYNSTYAGINLENQMEHGSFTPYNYVIDIAANTIFESDYYAIEMAYANGVTIRKNRLSCSQIMGVYAYASINISVYSNDLAYFSVGIWFEATTNSFIQSNRVMSIYPDLGNNAIKLTATSPNNSVSGNLIQGQYNYDLIADSANNNPTETIYEEFYLLPNEIQIFRISG
jgi:hypothetical protein